MAYAILRSIPNKLGGVIGLILSVGVLLRLLLTSPSYLSLVNNPILKVGFCLFVVRSVVLA
jgi:quinol-cytochrome oxidoreductase complex cytochrome b subunit